jgi:hypothetical protein
MDLPLLVINIQVFSLDTDTRYLTSSEGILTGNAVTEIKIPLFDARLINGGPIVGERYFVRYLDGIGEESFPADFFYIGMIDNQLVFSSAVVQPA